MVEQFGFAIMPWFHSISSGFTSGTTNGTLSFILHAEELSITTAPAFAAHGAYFKEVSPPALNRAISIFLPSNQVSVSSKTVYSSPINFIFFPALLFEAKR